MSVFTPNFNSIAVGWNNQPLLQPLNWMNAKGFSPYSEFIETVFVAYQSKVLAGNRRFKKKGLPTATWTFPYLKDDAIEWTRTTFFATGKLDSPVTLRTLDLEDNLWKDYNAYFDYPLFYEQNRRTGFYEVAFSFRELILLP